MCRILQSSDADLKFDNIAAADVTKTDAPFFCNNVLPSLFSDCTVSANGLKISGTNGNYAHKVSSKPSFLTIKMPKAPGWHVKAIHMKPTQVELQHPKSP